MHIFAAPRLSLAGLLLTLLLAATAASADELAEANKLLRAGETKQALERVEKLLAQRPGDPQARFLKGLIYTEQGNSRAAIDIFQKLTQDYPELPEPFNNLAVVYASQGQYDKARVALERSIRTHPSYATAYENLGDVYAKLASQAYDKALKLDSTNAGAQNKLALVRDLVGAPSREAPASIAAAAPPQTAAAKPEAPAVKPEAPAATPQTPAAKPGAEPEDVLAAVTAWATAWSRQDVSAYLASYARDFKPPNGESRADWEKQRRARVSGPKSIAVKIDFAKVRDLGNGKVSITFSQDYRSDRFRSSSNKTLLMEKSQDGHWRILQEQVSS
jgi:Flp pilus assembly protein TadD/ketosteroid isomerase-like protein